jgi:hypothetical protein
MIGSLDAATLLSSLQPSNCFDEGGQHPRLEFQPITSRSGNRYCLPGIIDRLSLYILPYILPPCAVLEPVSHQGGRYPDRRLWLGARFGGEPADHQRGGHAQLHVSGAAGRPAVRLQVGCLVSGLLHVRADGASPTLQGLRHAGTCSSICGTLFVVHNGMTIATCFHKWRSTILFKEIFAARF